MTRYRHQPRFTIAGRIIPKLVDMIKLPPEFRKRIKAATGYTDEELDRAVRESQGDFKKEFQTIIDEQNRQMIPPPEEQEKTMPAYIKFPEVKLRIKDDYILFEGIARLDDDLAAAYWIQDMSRSEPADETSDLSDCAITNCDGQTIFEGLQCWCHAQMVVALLDQFEYWPHYWETGKPVLALRLPKENDNDPTEHA